MYTVRSSKWFSKSPLRRRTKEWPSIITFGTHKAILDWKEIINWRSDRSYVQKPKRCDTSQKCCWKLLKVIKNQLESENGLQVTAIDANKLWTRQNEQLNYHNKKRGNSPALTLMKKFLCVNEIKNATSIIRRLINTTLPKDAISNSKFKSVPSIPCS